VSAYKNDSQVLIALRLEQARTALEEASVLLHAGKTTLGAVNRTYYAMFYAVLALLQEAGETPRKHSGVIALFDQKFVKTGRIDKNFSKELHRAFKLRQVSDYHPVESIAPSEAEELRNNAEAFIQKIVEILHSS